MATVYHWGPYIYYPPGGMPVGGAFNVAWTSDQFAQCTFNVTGRPYSASITQNTNFCVWVRDMSLQLINATTTDIKNYRWTAYTTFGNDGAETLTAIEAWLTVTIP